MKKVIRVAHLYYDLLNLYGENGNIAALKRFIARQGVACEVTNLSINDKIDFQKYDFFYMGSGCEDSELLVLSDLYERIDDIKEAIEAGKMFLVTGNAMELFGQKIKMKTQRDVVCLGIFDYNAIESRNRIVGEVFYDFDELSPDKGRKIVGFKNCNSNIVNNDAERPFKTQDNIRYKNFFAMEFVGPVLMRNPYFTDYLLSSLFENKNWHYEIHDDEVEYTAYREYIKNFIQNANLD